MSIGQDEGRGGHSQVEGLQEQVVVFGRDGLIR